MYSFARLGRGALTGGAVALYFSACGVPDFGFQDSKDAGTDVATDRTGGSGGTAGDGSSGTGGIAGAAGDAGIDVSPDADSGTTACTSNADCSATPALPVCDTTSGNCVECLPT